MLGRLVSNCGEQEQGQSQQESFRVDIGVSRIFVSVRGNAVYESTITFPLFVSSRCEVSRDLIKQICSLVTTRNDGKVGLRRLAKRHERKAGCQIVNFVDTRFGPVLRRTMLKAATAREWLSGTKYFWL